jgi:hypothetical protein
MLPEIMAPIIVFTVHKHAIASRLAHSTRAAAVVSKTDPLSILVDEVERLSAFANELSLGALILIRARTCSGLSRCRFPDDWPRLLRRYRKQGFTAPDVDRQKLIL